MIAGEEHTPDPMEAHIVAQRTISNATYSEELKLFHMLLQIMKDSNMTTTSNTVMVVCLALMFLIVIIATLAKYRHRLFIWRQ